MNYLEGPFSGPFLGRVLTLAVALGLVAGCSTPSRHAEPMTMQIKSVPLYEGTPPQLASNITTTMRTIRAQSCANFGDKNRLKREVDASLSRQAKEKGASAVIRVKYKEFYYNNRGSCRPGLLAVGTPVSLQEKN